MVTEADDWTLYAGHRERFTQALRDTAGPAGGRLCLLGAGPCDDVDLEALSRVFSEIHLVDLDAAALARAVARQPPEVRARLRPHARVDLAGLSKRLPKWKRKPPAVPQIERSAQETLQATLARLPGPFDVVASACVLTQMAFAVRDALGDGHPMLGLVRLSVIANHLRTLVGLTAVGGAALFVTDVVSSTVFPVAGMQGDPRAALDAIVASGHAYHSANPRVVHAILGQEPLGSRVGEPDLLEPWKWTGRQGRTYFVYALRIPRRA